MQSTDEGNSSIGSETKAETKVMNGITLFKELGDIIEEKSFKVMQVIAEDAALVLGKSNHTDMYVGTVYLIMNKEGK